MDDGGGLRMVKAIALACFLAGCAGPTDGRWVGPVTPEQATCGSATRGLLEADGGNVMFTPSEGVLVLRGQVAKDGTMTAQSSTVGQAHQAVVTSFSGKISNGNIEGTLTQQGCTSRVALKPG